MSAPVRKLTQELQRAAPWPHPRFPIPSWTLMHNAALELQRLQEGMERLALPWAFAYKHQASPEEHARMQYASAMAEGATPGSAEDVAIAAAHSLLEARTDPPVLEG